jgi:hypothetical protein
MATKLENCLKRNKACIEAQNWIHDKGITTIAQVWEQSPEPAWMLWGLEYAGHEEGSSRQVRKWVHHCLLLVYNYLGDPRCQRALKVLEAYAAGGSTGAEMEDALASAGAAASARASADADARRASPHFHATRAVVAGLAFPDNQWAKWANEATAYAAMAAAQNGGGVDREALVDHRRKQADALRSVFSGDITGLIANLEDLH